MKKDLEAKIKEILSSCFKETWHSDGTTETDFDLSQEVDQILKLIDQSNKCIHGEKCIECLADLGNKGLLPV